MVWAQANRRAWHQTLSHPVGRAIEQNELIIQHRLPQQHVWYQTMFVEKIHPGKPPRLFDIKVKNLHIAIPPNMWLAQYASHVSVIREREVIKRGIVDGIQIALISGGHLVRNNA